LDINLCPSILEPITQLDQLVVDAHHEQQHSHRSQNYNCQNKQANFHKNLSLTFAQLLRQFGAQFNDIFDSHPDLGAYRRDHHAAGAARW